jgi:hypothetical protein
MSNTNPCFLTCFLTAFFIWAGLTLIIVIGGIAVWLPIEIKQGGETLKARGYLQFEANNQNN